MSARQSSLTPNERQLLDEALAATEAVLIAISEHEEPSTAKRLRCPMCEGNLSVENCPTESKFNRARDVVRRGKERA